MTLDEWMVEHHDPAWKFKPYKVPKPSKLHAQRGKAFAWAAKDYQYRAWKDLRTIFEPVSLERFMALKHDPNWKPKKRSERVLKLPVLSAKERQALQREISAYVASHQRKVAA